MTTQKLFWLILSLLMGGESVLCAFTTPIAIKEINDDNIEEARIAARALIHTNALQSKAVRMVCIGMIATILVHKVLYKWNTRSHDDIATQLEQMNQKLTALEMRVPSAESVICEEAPVIPMGQQFRNGVSTIAHGVFGVMQYGFVTILGLTALAPVQPFIAGLLQNLSVITFLEKHTTFKVHVLALLEALDEYSAVAQEISKERRTVLMTVIQHTGNCIMRDVEQVIGYLYAVTDTIADGELTEYQAQEKDFLLNYCIMIKQAGNDMAHTIEEISSATPQGVVSLSHVVRDQSQRIYNDCHALVNVEEMLRRR